MSMGAAVIYQPLGLRLAYSTCTLCLALSWASEWWQLLVYWWRGYWCWAIRARERQLPGVRGLTQRKGVYALQTFHAER